MLYSVLTYSVARLTALIMVFGACLVSASEAPEETHQHESHAHTVAVFVGYATEGRREDGIALGIEYERRISTRFGIGALAEFTAGDIDAWVFAVPFAYHHGPWKFYVAPGIEDPDEGGSEHLIRIGAEYGFHAGEWEIAPQLDIDFVDSEEVYVVGVVFAREF